MTNRVSVSLRMCERVCVCKCVCVRVCVCVGLRMVGCLRVRLPLFHSMKHLIMSRFKTAATALISIWCAVVDFEDLRTMIVNTFILLV